MPRGNGIICCGKNNAGEGERMKLEIFLIDSSESWTTIWSDENYNPNAKDSESLLMKGAVDFALATVIATYFKGAFGVSRCSISASAGVLRQRVKCSGRNVRLEANYKGVMAPVEDNSSMDREFEIELRLDLASPS